MRRSTAIAAGAVGVTLVGAGIALLAGNAAGVPQRTAVEPPMAPGRLVHFHAEDGVRLVGSYWPGSDPAAPAILLLHGITVSRTMFAARAAWLASLGYAVFAIDFRGHGESQHAPRTFGWRESLDAHAALAWLRQERPDSRIGVIGVSMGGAAALIGPRGPLPADAMVLQAVYSTIRRAIGNRVEGVAGRGAARLLEPLLSFQSVPRYRVRPRSLSPLAAIRHYAGPVFVIGGSGDRHTVVEETEALHEAAPGPKRLWIIPGADHYDASACNSDEYRERIAAFFADTIGTPAVSRVGEA